MICLGWRPRRTLILASWGGDGVTGAANLVSQFQQSLRARVVAYIDIHHVTRGAVLNYYNNTIHYVKLNFPCMQYI